MKQDQGSYGEFRMTKHDRSGEQKNTWRCPNDDTLNTGETCIVCGRPKQTKKKSGLWKVLLAVALVGVAALLYFARPKPQPTPVPKPTQAAPKPTAPPKKEDFTVAKGSCGDGATWTLDKDGLLTVSGVGEMDDFENYTQTPWAEYSEKIKSLKVEHIVTAIGKHAFEECKNLQHAEIADSVKFIEDSAFANSGLSTVSMPEELLRISPNAFEGCPLKIIDLPDGLQVIHENAFAYSGLVSVTLPDSVTKVEEGAFSDCYNLTSVTLSKEMDGISESTFANCYKLARVTIPKGITWISSYAFAECGSLKQIEIPVGVTWIRSGAFYHAGLRRVSLPDSLRDIGSNAFEGCEMTAIDLPEGLERIYDGAFAYTGLTKVVVPNSVTRFGESVFFYCTDLTTATLSQDMYHVPANTFSGCEKLSVVNLPQRLITIGTEAFSECYALKEVTVSRDCQIDDTAFPSETVIKLR